MKQNVGPSPEHETLCAHGSPLGHSSIFSSVCAWMLPVIWPSHLSWVWSPAPPSLRPEYLRSSREPTDHLVCAQEPIRPYLVLVFQNPPLLISARQMPHFHGSSGGKLVTVLQRRGTYRKLHSANLPTLWLPGLEPSSSLPDPHRLWGMNMHHYHVINY